MIANTFRAFLSQKLDAGGSETVINIDRITTLTGEEINTSDFSDFSRGILTVNPDADGVTSFSEYISFTGVSGLTLTGATRGLSAKSNSVIAANKRFHSADTPVILSFGSHNIQDVLDYIDAQIAALTLGANVVATGTAAETVAAGELVYLNGDGKWALCDADTAATVVGVILGIAQGAGSADGAITNGVLLWGVDTNQTGLTTGEDLYASNTAGEIANSAGTTERKIGQAKTSTTLFFDPSFAVPGLEGGGDFGTPSSANKVITEEFLAARTPEIVTFDTSGTWTKDAGLLYIIVEGVGGGGGGGSSIDSGGGDGSGGCPGASGGYFRKIILASALGATETVTIGAGGAIATVGGTTSFGSHCQSTGGGAGVTGWDGESWPAGGVATGGDINIAGNQPISGGTDNTDNANEDPTPGGRTPSVLGSKGAGGRSGSDDLGDSGEAGQAGFVIVTEFYS